MENQIEKTGTNADSNVYCDKFKTGKLIIELPNINNYSRLSHALKSIIDSIGFISDCEVQTDSTARLLAINELSSIANSMICSDEFYYLDKVIENTNP